MKSALGTSNNIDWGLKKEYLHSTRQNLWNDDYFEFLVKCVWKIDKPVRIIDFGCGYGYFAQMLLPLVPKGSAGFLTKICGKERSTTDYLLVWYESSTKTEYYFTGADYIIKHGGKIGLPDDIMRFIRKKCQEMRNKNNGE